VKTEAWRWKSGEGESGALRKTPFCLEMYTLELHNDYANLGQLVPDVAARRIWENFLGACCIHKNARYNPCQAVSEQKRAGDFLLSIL
jgi:hypothetical protein